MSALTFDTFDRSDLILVKRSGWGARTNRIGRYAIGPVDEVVIHHFYSPDVPGVLHLERTAMRGVENVHASKGWSAAPGYTFCAGQSGVVYESTGWGRSGVHTQTRNYTSVAIALMINGDDKLPTERCYFAVRNLIALGIEIGAIREKFKIEKHNTYAPYKSCPGIRVRRNGLEKFRPLDEDDIVTPGDIEEITNSVVNEVVDRLRNDEVLHDAIARKMLFQTRFKQYGVHVNSPEDVNLATAVNRAALAAVKAAESQLDV